jgi:hypothetical protein
MHPGGNEVLNASGSFDDPPACCLDNISRQPDAVGVAPCGLPDNKYNNYAQNDTKDDKTWKAEAHVSLLSG